MRHSTQTKKGTHCKILGTNGINMAYNSDGEDGFGHMNLKGERELFGEKSDMELDDISATRNGEEREDGQISD